jgi:hypothetical protein
VTVQVKLLIDLETALPPWFVSRIQMRYSQHSTGEGTMRHWVLLVYLLPLPIACMLAVRP